MNLWKVKNPRKDLRFEIAFTKAYRDAVRTYTHPAQIELACLKAQYPAIMMPIEDDDVLAGRIQMGLVGMGIQGQTGGTGYYIDEPRVTQALEQQSGDAKYREDLHDLLTFWKGHCTYNIVLEETPEEIRRVIPTEFPLRRSFGWRAHTSITIICFRSVYAGWRMRSAAPERPRRSRNVTS